MTSNKSIVESLKKEVLTIKQCSAEECKKVDQRISAMYQILKDEGSRIKSEIQNSNLKQAQVMSDMTKDVEEHTRQMSAFGKQIREVLNRRQLEEFLNITPKVRQAISDTSMVLFTVPNYECTHFQDGVVCNKKLSKLIGKVHNPEKNRYECSLDNNPASGINKKAHKFAVNKDFLQDSDDDDVEDYECNPNISVVHFNRGGRNQFECSFDVIYGDQHSPFNEVLGNQDPLSQFYTIQGVVWRVECVLMSTFKPRLLVNRYVKLQLHSPSVKCRAIFKLKIININDSESLINEGEHFFSNNGKDSLLSGNSVSHTVTRKTISGQKEDIWKHGNYFRANISYPDSMKKTISEQTGNIRKHSTKMGQYTPRKAPSQGDNYVPFRSCDSMEDSYVWDQLESDYILNPRYGFINSNNQVTIQVIFSSIDCLK
ncbi:hypothetical protein SNE40_013929 [Patella caerulea]|uniref:Uncharacterized protein n=1 Tax=Patella caerulea TaxID=87958 RepID=A0AAN8PRH2_PATCE